MNTKQAIRAGIDMAHTILTSYVKDLNDEELFERPVPEANHIAWQLGHLISSERNMIEQVRPGTSPALPEGFADRYTKETAKSDDAPSFHTKAQYLELYNAQRQATLKALQDVPDSDLDTPAPEGLRSICPTVGAVFVLQGTHELMHAGQFTPVRRKLGKPVVF